MDNFDLRKYLAEGTLHNEITEKKQDSKKGNENEQKRMEGSIKDDRDHIKNLKKDIDANERKLARLKKDYKRDVIKEDLLDYDGEDMYQVIKNDMKSYYKMDVPVDIIKDWADGYFPNTNYGEDEYEFETSAREDFLTNLNDEFGSGDSRPDWWGVSEGIEKSTQPNTKMKVSELKAKIKEDILAELALNEKEEVDVDIDVEDEVDVDVEADDIEIEKKGTNIKVEVGLSPEEELIQDSLKAAMDAANSLGNDKLADQIGNTITFFTREYVVGNR
jgi:urease accessory protein UreE